MVQSINTKSELVIEGTAFMGMPAYGKIMIGDKGFEFFNEKNVRDFYQIPWNEVDWVIASVIFKGKWIPRFASGLKSKWLGFGHLDLRSLHVDCCDCDCERVLEGKFKLRHKRILAKVSPKPINPTSKAHQQAQSTSV